MKNKILEIRDAATFISVVAMRTVPENDAEVYHLSRNGYHPGIILLLRLNDQRGGYDPYGWDSTRTMVTAHNYIIENYDSLKDGDVIDVEYILGITKEKKESESRGRFLYIE